MFNLISIRVSSCLANPSLESWILWPETKFCSYFPIKSLREWKWQGQSWSDNSEAFTPNDQINISNWPRFYTENYEKKLDHIFQHVLLETMRLTMLRDLLFLLNCSVLRIDWHLCKIGSFMELLPETPIFFKNLAILNLDSSSSINLVTASPPSLQLLVLPLCCQKNNRGRRCSCLLSDTTLK